MSRYVAAPLNPSQQTFSFRAAQYKKARKRKREEQDEEDQAVSSDRDHDHDTSRAQSVFDSLSAQEAAQYRLAGLSPDEEIPPPPFPHAPAVPARARLNPPDVQRQLAALNPPLYSATSTSQSDRLDDFDGDELTNLRSHHIRVLTTLMHRCLVRGDYQRAGRAWGMLLRSQFNGRSIDVRAHGRWGIGAEILMGRSSREVPHASGRPAAEPASMMGQHLGVQFFTSEGFRAAREYYERLILHYPGRASHPHSIDASTFYPVMFNLWIYEICERSKEARHVFELSEEKRGFHDDMSEQEDDAMSTSGHSSASVAERRRASFEGELHEKELSQASELVDVLDPLLVSPPFDKHTELLHIRGMVALWMADLMAKTARANRDSDEQGGGNRWAESKSHAMAVEAERMKAKKFFKRVQETKGQVWEGVANILAYERDGSENMNDD